jgi:hypothetical protein
VNRKLGNLVAGCAAVIFFAAVERASAITTVADMAIYFGSSSNSVQVGQQMQFFLTLSNGGPGMVVGAITITNQLAVDFQYVSSAGNGSYNPNNRAWTVVPGASGNTNFLMITVQATTAGIYTNTATITAIPVGVTDPNPANNTASARVTVISPIVLTCSSNLTITASTPNGTNVYFTTSAYGGCSSPLTLSSSPPSGSTFPIGQTIVTTTASDNCGDSTNCTFTITVNAPKFTGITLIQGGIKLNWPANFGLLLQQSDDLGTSNWTMVTNTPTITNGQNELILSPAKVNGFYRLVNP